jgi:hypothetical protein
MPDLGHPIRFLDSRIGAVRRIDLFQVTLCRFSVVLIEVAHFGQLVGGPTEISLRAPSTCIT